MIVVAMTREEKKIHTDNKRLYHAELPWVQVASPPHPLLSMLAPKEVIQVLFINVAQTMVGFVCGHTQHLLKFTKWRLPCSESVEMVEPMLSVRIRSTDPDTESCSRRRLR